MKYRFSSSAIHITELTCIDVPLTLALKAKIKVCSKTLLSKKPHHVEATQLTFIECQMSGLYTTQGITKRSLRTDLKSPELLKIVKIALKLLKSLLKILF